MSNTKAAINNINNNSGSGRGGGINGGTQACAACKYQRRKCAPDCILAPYFPHDSQRQFRNAHKLFGVSNITKIIRDLQPSLKDHAMRTIIFQSDVRAADPVGGCYAIIRHLHRQIQIASAELDLVLQHLALCRAQAEAAARTYQPHVPFPNAAADDDSSLLLHVQEQQQQQQQSPMLLHVHQIQEQQQQQPHYLRKDEEEEEEEQFFLQHDQEDNQVVPLQQDIASWAMQDTASSSLHDVDNNNNNNKQNQSHHLINESQDFKPASLDINGDRLELKFYLQQEETTTEQGDEAIFNGQQGHTER